MQSISSEKFCGQIVKKEQLLEIIEIIDTFPNLSRTELAHTVCELFSWKRPTGKLKGVECRQFLERLDANGVIHLPLCRKQFVKKAKTKVPRTDQSDSPATISVKLRELAPILLTRVDSKQQRQLWYEYVDRYHYLGYQLPFGAQLRYFIKAGATHDILGCFQFSSPAWKMAPRDRWIGWSDEQRKVKLQKIINNSRFLIFPWVEVKNLASSALALAAKTVADDWQHCYGYRPVLMETLVDQKRFKGTCYKAANWIHMGKTTGRGRMDRDNKQQGAAVKEIYVYPLISQFRQELAGL
jgi:Druantia protein DruA